MRNIQLFELFGKISLDDQASDGISAVDDKAEKAGGKFGKFAKTVGVGAVAIGAAAVGAGASMYKMATSSAETTDRIDKLSQKIGLSRTGFQEWDFIMSQSGGSVEGLQMGFKTMVNSMDQAIAGTGKGADSFKKLGISVKDANGNVKDQETVFNEAVIALQGMEEGTEKAKLANDLFGRSGAEMMPLLNGAVGSVEDMKKQAHELGLVLSDDAVDAGVAFTDTIDQLERSFATAVAAIGVEFMPVITKFADFIIANMPTIQAVISTAFGIATKVIGLLVTAIGFVIDAIGQFFIKARDSLGGVEGLFEKFGPIIDTLKGVFSGFLSYLEPIWEQLKELFKSLEPILIAVAAIVGGVLVAAFGVAISVFAAVISAIGPLIQAVISIGEIVVNMVNVVVALLRGDFAGAWKYLEKIAKSTKDFFVNIFTAIVNFVKTFIKTIIDFFKNLYMTLVGNSIVPDMVNAIVDWFKKMFQWVIDIVKNIVKMVTENFKLLVDNIKAALELAKSIITAILNYWKDTFKNVLNFLKSLVKGDFQGMKDAIQSQMNNIKNLISNIWNSIKSFFSSVISNIVSTATTNFNNLKSTATNIFNNVKDAMVKPIEKARDLISSAIEKVKGFFSGLKLKFPKIDMPKLPSFNMTGKFSLNPPSVPKLGINWNALGGIANGPTILNTSRGLQGFGEVPGESEAFLPLNDRVLGAIGRGIAELMPDGDKPEVKQTINFYNVKDSPSEDARKQKRAAEEALRGW